MDGNGGLVPVLPDGPREHLGLPHAIRVGLDALQDLGPVRTALVGVDNVKDVPALQRGGSPPNLVDHAPVDRLLCARQIVDGKVQGELVVVRVLAKKMIDVVEHGHVATAGFHHAVDVDLLGLFQEQGSQQLGKGPIPAEDCGLVVGILIDNVIRRNGVLLVVAALRQLRRRPRIQPREFFVAERADHVVELPKERVGSRRQGLSARRGLRWRCCCSSSSSLRTHEGLGQQLAEPRLVHAGRLSDAVDARHQNGPGLLLGGSIGPGCIVDGAVPVALVDDALQELPGGGGQGKVRRCFGLGLGFGFGFRFGFHRQGIAEFVAVSGCHGPVLVGEVGDLSQERLEAVKVNGRG
mmetsp:Transcript_1336/g.3406  ORF Transcript_1336/g.3406 Transcript_1336/m.3406 type:complete len:352 (-) Transcript_1336:452-1507(-)